jgi:hypothetical protein
MRADTRGRSELMPYDHQLSDALSRRGMRAMFAVAAPKTMAERTLARRYDFWCSILHSRAQHFRIAWMPATGEAYTEADVSTTRVEAILLRVLENTPADLALRPPLPPTEKSA